MLHLSPLTLRLRRLLGRSVPDFFATAIERWEVSPACEMHFPAAVMLPGQLDRIRRTEFGTMRAVRAMFQGDLNPRIGPTMAYRFRDVDHADGVLYCGGAELHLRERKNRLPVYRRPDVSVSGSMYESWLGNRWFGNWLTDDCDTYFLAAEAGQPLTTAPVPAAGHVARYEALQGMAPRRIGDAHFTDLVLFDNILNNEGRIARAKARRALLTRGFDTSPGPGVFLMRGQTGDRRLLVNELALAEHLERRHGFRVMLPAEHSVDELVAACARAPVIVGVEGSHLTHGLVAMPGGGALLTIQPPERVTAALKLVCDRMGLRFGVVVAEGDADSFRVDPAEVDRTLELLT